MATKKYTFHCDAGHGWLEVPLADILKLGLKPEDFSRYSYCNVSYLYTPTMYLEEDIDMQVFMLAAIRAGVDVEMPEAYVHGDSHIRSYGTNTVGRDFDAADIRGLAQALEMRTVRPVCT